MAAHGASRQSRAPNVRDSSRAKLGRAEEVPGLTGAPVGLVDGAY